MISDEVLRPIDEYEYGMAEMPNFLEIKKRNISRCGLKENGSKMSETRIR